MHPTDTCLRQSARWLCAVLPWLALGSVVAQSAPGAGALPSPPAFSAMPVGAPDSGWRVAGLPKQKFPLTRFDVMALDGRHVLRVQADASYGNLVFDTGHARIGPNAVLHWSWQLERGLPASDLASKQGDDSPLKLCVLFDLPLDGLGFAERTRMRLARSLSGEALPGATLCYVWDRLLPAGTALANAYTPRVRYIVVNSGEARAGQWFSHERRLAADFLRAFGHEAPVVPPLLAVLVGADADNTAGRSMAYVGDVVLTP